MREFTSIYNELNNYFDLPENSLSVVEKQISATIKSEYFELSRRLQYNTEEIDVIDKKDKIFERNTTREEKKTILTQLALLNNIEAFRTIERFIKQPNIQLYDWAYLALKESKLQIESDLMDEYRLLISTGLGGKGLNLRYFAVMLCSDDSFSQKQESVLQQELVYQLNSIKGELEDVIIEDNIASLLLNIPLNVQLDSFFKKVISECNAVGEFVCDDYFITNVKVLSFEEITEILAINNLV